MGILDFVKGGVKEMAIARPDSTKDQWVYKHPDQTIPWKAQLTVDSDEIAMFFKNGAYVGSLAAGRHTPVEFDQLVGHGAVAHDTLERGGLDDSVAKCERPQAGRCERIRCGHAVDVLSVSGAARRGVPVDRGHPRT